MRLVLLGAPGSGKGTQAKLLASEFGLLHVAPGDIFRSEIRAGTELESWWKASWPVENWWMIIPPYV